MLLDAIVLAVVMALVLVLFRPRLRRSTYWRATVTPLASIIGSGFLVVAPLLGYAVGIWAPLAMVGIVLLAHAIGAVVRFNIVHVEPLLGGNRYLGYVERLSNVSLAAAYLISVAFYVRLLVSFLLHPLHLETGPWLANGVTTVVLAAVAATGLLRGLQGLEWMEEAAVNVKLSIIAALLVGLVWFDAGWLAGDQRLTTHPVSDTTHALRLVAGMLLVVQGFETSRYMGAAYDAGMRVRAMRHAQWLAAAIYVVFVSLALPLLGAFREPPAETAIIDISQRVASVLPALLVVAAVMSQLSAAVADTVGSGGMMAEVSGGRLSSRVGYVLVVAAAIALVWAIDLFAIIAVASRAFALYYLLQCAGAWIAAGELENPRRRRALRSAIFALGAVMALVVIFAIPAESA